MHTYIHICMHTYSTHLPNALTLEPSAKLREALLACCEHEDNLVRAVSLEALPLVFERGERDAVMTLVRYIYIYICIYICMCVWVCVFVCVCVCMHKKCR